MLNTLRVAIIGIVLTTVLGTLLGVGRFSHNALVRGLCYGYVELFRNVPVLLQLLMWYLLLTECAARPGRAALAGRPVLPQQGRPVVPGAGVGARPGALRLLGACWSAPALAWLWARGRGALRADRPSPRPVLLPAWR